MFGWKRGLCLIGAAASVAACGFDRSGPNTVGDPGAQQILMRMQEIVDKGQITDPNLVGQTFGTTSWNAVTRSGKQTCEASSEQGDRLSFRVISFRNPTRSCSDYVKGPNEFEPGFTYFLEITVLNLPCLSMNEIQSASTRLGWKFELGGGKIGGVSLVQRNGVLRWTAPATEEGKPQSGTVIVSFDSVHESDPALAVKLDAPNRCATGHFLLAYN